MWLIKGLQARTGGLGFLWHVVPVLLLTPRITLLHKEVSSPGPSITRPLSILFQVLAVAYTSATLLLEKRLPHYISNTSFSNANSIRNSTCRHSSSSSLSDLPRGHLEILGVSLMCAIYLRWSSIVAQSVAVRQFFPPVTELVICTLGPCTFKFALHLVNGNEGS